MVNVFVKLNSSDCASRTYSVEGFLDGLAIRKSEQNSIIEVTGMRKSILRRMWQEAGITNDFIFGNVIQMGNNCRDLLRAILPELHIQRVKLINTKKDIRNQHDQRGVRLDVFAEDECMTWRCK